MLAFALPGLQAYNRPQAPCLQRNQCVSAADTVQLDLLSLLDHPWPRVATGAPDIVLPHLVAAASPAEEGTAEPRTAAVHRTEVAPRMALAAGLRMAAAGTRMACRCSR